MTFQLVGGDTANLDAVVNQVNQNIAQLKVQDTTNIFKDDTGTRRVLLGKGKDNFYGLKVSQEGTDVYDGDDADMVFNSNNNVFKIVSSGTLTLEHTIGANTTTTTASVAHGLDYTPALHAYITLDADIMSGNLANSKVPNPYPIIYLIGAGSDVTLMGMAQVYIDETNVYFTLQTDGVGGGPYSCSAKYYLLQESFS